MIYIIGQVRWKLKGVSCIVSKCHELLCTNGLKLDRNFTRPPSIILHYTSLPRFADRGQQTELSNSDHKRLKVELEFSHTLTVFCSVSSSSYTLYSGINLPPHGEFKWNGIGFVCSPDSKPQQDFSLTMAWRRAALSGNASLIATFLVYINSV